MQHKRDIEKEVEAREKQEALVEDVISKSRASKNTSSGDKSKEWKDLAMRLKKLYEEKQAPLVPKGPGNMRRPWH